MIFRIFFVIIAYLNFEIKQINVKIVFFNKNIDVEIYVKFFDDFNEKKICKFNKALYNFKQSFCL